MSWTFLDNGPVSNLQHIQVVTCSCKYAIWSIPSALLELGHVINHRKTPERTSHFHQPLHLLYSPSDIPWIEQNSPWHFYISAGNTTAECSKFMHIFTVRTNVVLCNISGKAGSIQFVLNRSSHPCALFTPNIKYSTRHTWEPLTCLLPQ